MLLGTISEDGKVRTYRQVNYKMQDRSETQPIEDKIATDNNSFDSRN